MIVVFQIEGQLHSAVKNLLQVANIVNNFCAIASVQLSTLTGVFHVILHCHFKSISGSCFQLYWDK